MEIARTARLRGWPDPYRHRGNNGDNNGDNHRRPGGRGTAPRTDLDRGSPARHGSPLLETLDRCLDQGVVVEGWARVSALGLEVVTVQADAFVASFETYLRHAAALEQTAVEQTALA